MLVIHGKQLIITGLFWLGILFSLVVSTLSMGNYNYYCCRFHCSIILVIIILFQYHFPWIYYRTTHIYNTHRSVWLFRWTFHRVEHCKNFLCSWPSLHFRCRPRLWWRRSIPIMQEDKVWRRGKWLKVHQLYSSRWG